MNVWDASINQLFEDQTQTSSKLNESEKVEKDK